MLLWYVTTFLASSSVAWTRNDYDSISPANTQYQYQSRPSPQYSTFDESSQYTAPFIDLPAQAPLFTGVLPAQQLPLVPSASIFPAAQNSALLTRTNSIFTPDIVHRRHATSKIANTVLRDGNLETNSRITVDNTEDPSRSNDEDSANTSSEWIYDPNSRRVFSGELEKPKERSSNEAGGDSRKHNAMKRIDTMVARERGSVNRDGSDYEELGMIGDNRRRALCLSSGCRTWITITIPKHGAGGANTGMNRIESSIISTTYETKCNKESTNEDSNNNMKANSTDANSIISAASSKKSKKKSKNRPQGSSIKSTGSIFGGEMENSKSVSASFTSAPPASSSQRLTTKSSESAFIFSTSWVLSLKRATQPPLISTVTDSPSEGFKASSTKSSTDEEEEGKNSDKKGGVSKPKDTIHPFTFKPKFKSGTVTSSTSGPSVGRTNGPKSSPEPFDALITKRPWTHSSAGASKPTHNKKAKHRPQPQTEKASNIKEAAIWASKELIDAIREALERFRAALYLSGADVHYEPGDADAQRALTEHVEHVFEKFKQGSFLERAVADAMLEDATLLNRDDAGEALVDAISSSLYTKLSDDPEYSIAGLLSRSPVENRKTKRRNKRDTNSDALASVIPVNSSQFKVEMKNRTEMRGNAMENHKRDEKNERRRRKLGIISARWLKIKRRNGTEYETQRKPDATENNTIKASDKDVANPSGRVQSLGTRTNSLNTLNIRQDQLRQFRAKARWRYHRRTKPIEPYSRSGRPQELQEQWKEKWRLNEKSQLSFLY